MIWFSAESAGMSISPSARGPIAIPTTRNTATSGILIFCANRPVRVPMARISPHESSVCLAISSEVTPILQGLQPDADFTGRDIGLLQQFTHGEEAVELAGKMPVGHGDAGCLQAALIFVALVAQGIGAGGQHIGRRQADQGLGARRRCAPVVNVGGAVEVAVVEIA